MSRSIAVVIALSLAAACSSNPAPSTAAGSCAGTRYLVVTNGGDEAVNVYAANGRNSTEVGTVPQGKKELKIPANVRATSYYAVAISRMAIGGSPISATTDTRVTFIEECRPVSP